MNLLIPDTVISHTVILNDTTEFKDSKSINNFFNIFFDELWNLCSEDRIIGDTSIVWVFENYNVSVYIDEVLSYTLDVKSDVDIIHNSIYGTFSSIKYFRLKSSHSTILDEDYMDEEYMEAFNNFWNKWGTM